MTPQPDGRSKFIEEANLMSKKRDALMGVIAVRDPILPPKRLTNLTYDIIVITKWVWFQC